MFRYILDDANINLNKHKHLPDGIKQYQEFWLLHGLKQLITFLTRITENCLSLLDHVLTKSGDRMTQAKVIVCLSDHQLIVQARPHATNLIHMSKKVWKRDLVISTDCATL